MSTSFVVKEEGFYYIGGTEVYLVEGDIVYLKDNETLDKKEN